MIDAQELSVLRAAARGDAADMGQILEGFRPRLERMVAVRLDPRLRGRIEPGDVVQEAYVEVVERLPEYLVEPVMSFFVWVRFLSGQKLLQLHRRHLGAAGRDVRREVELPRRHGGPSASSVAIASAILDRGGTPSHAAMRNEQEEALRHTLDEMPEQDREVLALRHFEHLSNAEIAEIFEVSEPAASQRYFRALARLKRGLEALGFHFDAAII